MEPVPPTPHWRASLRVVAITDRTLVSDEEAFMRRCEDLFAAGLRGIILREKDMHARNMYDLCRRILPLARKHGALVILSDRVDVAIASGVDGVQLSSNSLPPRAVRHMVPPSFLIGASCHSEHQLMEAVAGRADYALVSPVFPPGRKDVPSVLGIEQFETIARSSKIPIIALGGITPGRAVACMRAGASGVAAIGALFGAENPGEAVEAFTSSLEVTK